MNLFTFRGLLVLALFGGLALHFRPWERAAPAGQGVVAGKALDADGRPVPGASVVLRDAKGVIIARVETEGDGAFEIADCPAGKYRLAAAKLGIGGAERTVLVAAHRRADASIPLAGPLVAPHR